MELLAIPLGNHKTVAKWLVIPRRREFGKKKAREADKSLVMTFYAGMTLSRTTQVQIHGGNSVAM